MAQLLINYMCSQGVGSLGETLRGNTWEVTIDGFTDVTLYATTATLPNPTVAQIEMNHFNQKLKIAGAADTPNISIEVLDTVNPKIAQKLYYWYLKVYEPLSGKIGYASEYKKRGTIMQYDTKGTLQRKWILEGMWPTTITMGSLDYTSADPIKIGIDFSVDRANMV